MDHTLFDKHGAESAARMRVLAALPKGSRIHLSAISGTGMAAVAALLKELGFQISGTDKAFYPPMGDVVRKLTTNLFEGYRAENLDPAPDFVVIGNNLSRSNPEVEAVIQRGIPFASMPEVFGALLIGDRKFCGNSIVVTGTHGKTTTSAAVATLLDKAGRKPGYFIGGVPNDLPGGLRAPDLQRPAAERVVVLEGDEYDSAFFAKWPKFLSYRPDILIVTSIEFDHADIYENLEEIEFEFSRLVSMLPKTGLVLVSDQGDSLQRLSAKWKTSAPCEVLSYGSEPASPLRVVRRVPDQSGQDLELEIQGELIAFHSSLTGAHNAHNLLAAAAAGKKIGLTAQEIAHGLSQFRGVLRRQTVHGELGGVLLVEDFAHHPTAVQLTLEGLRERYPGRRMIAAFEPRSNTTRQGFFQEEYPASFKCADLVLLLDVQEKPTYSNTKNQAEPFDVSKMRGRIQQLGITAKDFSAVNELKQWILSNTRPGDLLVCMSNGDFGGLVPDLRQTLGPTAGQP